MHTSPAYAEDVYVGSVSGLKLGDHFATFIVPVAAPGVTVLCRKIAVRDPNPFVAPLSSRFDELDGQMWLDDVAIPWEHVFLLGPSPEPVVRWLIWHHLYGWLAKAEFTLGLALALAHAMGLARHEQTIDYLVDLTAEVQTVRSCLVACERDPRFHRGRLVRPQPRASRRWRSGDVAGPPAHDRDLADRAGLVPGRGSRPTATSPPPKWPRASPNRLAAAAIPPCSARPCCRWPGTMSPRRSTAANRRSSCTPAAASRPGAAGWPRFFELQRPRQSRHRIARHCDAADRPRSFARNAVGPPPPGDAAAVRRQGLESHCRSGSDLRPR